MKLLVYEYYSSGAVQDQENLKKIGFAMLNAVLQDFIQLPELGILTILDDSFKNDLSLFPFKSKVHFLWQESNKHKEAILLFKNTMRQCDAVLIIAPETNGLLAKFTAIAEYYGKLVLGSSSLTLECIGNKAQTISLWAEHGLPVPKSKVFNSPNNVNTKKDILEQFNLPLIIKPLYGTGGSGVRLIKTQDQLSDSLQQLMVISENAFLVQEFISGQAVSVSCFVLEGRCIPISLNKQLIKEADELLIQGISVPYHTQQEENIFTLVTAACAVMNGLTGFVGIDLVLSQSGSVLIEVNARITMAYVALRKATDRNLARDLWALCSKHELPCQPKFKSIYTYMI